MSYVKIHKLYEEKFGELPYNIRDIRYTEKEELASQLLQDALLDNKKLNEKQIKSIIDIPELPDDAKL